MLTGLWYGEIPGLTLEFSLSNHNMIVTELFPMELEPPPLWLAAFPPEGNLCKTLVYKNKSFLLTKRRNPILRNQIANDIRAYTVTSNTLTFHRIKDHVIEEGIKSGQIMGELPKRRHSDLDNKNRVIDLRSSRISTLTTNALEYIVTRDNTAWEPILFTKENPFPTNQTVNNQ